jgi:amino acid adenylation domain-containing protein
MASVAPDAPAANEGGLGLTYRRLEARANQLARWLAAEGVSPGARVALAAPRGLDALIAQLAILKCGAAAAPLDPAASGSLLEQQIQSVKPILVLRSAGAAAAGHDIAAALAAAELLSDALLEVEIAADAPALVMLTSGSTGAPKPVLIPHRGIVRLVREQAFAEFGPDTVFLHASPVNFDASILETWGALLNGGQVALLPAAPPSLDDIAAALSRHAVTDAWFTSALFNLLVEHRLQALGGLRTVFTGGDVVSPAHVARAQSAWPDLQIVNGYGPTENTTFTACFRIPKTGWPEGALPIGAPLRHGACHVLDEALRPVAVGEKGRLWAAGDGVALGYLDLPEETAARFRDDPFSDEPGARMYDTGDIASWRDDGLLSFHGRADRQVKISGLRVELDGIEALLRAAPGVAEAAVIAPVGADGAKRLEAFVTPAHVDVEAVRHALQAALPAGMVPGRIIALAQIPMTAQGKIDRARLSQPMAPRAIPDRGMAARVAALWADVLDIKDPPHHVRFFELGGTSLQLVRLHARIVDEIGPIGLPVLFDRATIAQQAEALGAAPSAAPVRARSQSSASSGKIAIIGMALRTPGASSLDAFWEICREGRDVLTRFRPDELRDAVSPQDRARPDYVAARGVLEDAAAFDAAYFGIQAREAALTDPQHRVFLEVAQAAFDHAGYDPARVEGAVGVFAGASMSTYLLQHVLSDRARVEAFTSAYQLGMFPELMGALADALATRVAYKLDLKGPAATVQTACSTGLFAVAQAVQAIQSGQCAMALAGGVSITFPQERGYFYQDGAMGSRDGIVRPFDAEANGVVFGGGAGAVLLKALDAALADGDTIYAVIGGCGVNNDGAEKAAFTAPSATGQAGAIAAALQAAKVDPETVGYVECHGTATPLGDPIEFEGLARALGAAGAPLALGSTKANIGHLDAAAGVVGLIKTALVLHHGVIPPLANFKAPNPALALKGGRFVFPTQAMPWASDHQSPRRAGVSSFGVGGTNVHVVLEEAPHTEAPEAKKAGMWVVPLSALDEAALARVGAAMRTHLQERPHLALGDVAHTLQQGRRALPHRAAIVAGSVEEAIAKLAAVKGKASRPDPRVIFVFPGQGAQRAGMARALYERFPTFRADVDRMLDGANPAMQPALRRALLEPVGELRDTALAQPGIYILELALARLWMALGVRPAAMVGHSVGEFAAAALSGVFSEEDGLKLILARGRLMQAAPTGAMLSVRLSVQDVTPLLPAGVDVAGVNAPGLVVVSGPEDAIAGLERRLDDLGHAHRRLVTSHAFHSAMMDNAAAGLEEAAKSLRLSAPTLPIVSTVIGDWVGEDMTRPSYWARHARQPVLFGQSLSRAFEAGPALTLEVGPGKTLAALSAQNAPAGALLTAIASHHGDDDQNLTAFLEACAQLWMQGVALDWSVLEAPLAARRVALPPYPFARDRHWIEAPNAPAITTPPALGASPTSLPDVPPMTAAAPSRLSRLTHDVTALLESVSGAQVPQDMVEASFLELGFDSLSLGQVAAKLQGRFGVKIGFRQLLNDIPTPAALATYLDGVLPPDPVAQLEPQAAPAAHAAPQAAGAVSSSATPTGDLASVFQAQLAAVQAVIAQQNALLAGGGAPLVTPAAPPAAPTVQAPPPAAEPPSRFRMYSPAAQRQTSALSTPQEAYLRDLIKRWNEKTPGSKAYAAQHRPILADPRSVSGFRAEWKELIYPLVVRKAKGAWLTDVDGHSYVDLVNGYGQTAFGHAPDFVKEALARQVQDGFAIGPQSPLAGDVAALIAEFVGLERVTFCNTGSEAVMAAMRVARCVTGRETVVVFANDYHGQFDEVLVKPRAQTPGALPIAPGIPQSAVENMVVLPYGAPESLAWIEANAAKIAAVIVEPVQSRHPELRPFDFLKSLRVTATASSFALVFDEVVTGFRVHPGGMQAVTGVKADMATYGKVLGGGMPVGVLAGSAAFMDALDGGQWRFGDDSIPEVSPTFFAGTFVRHPLVLAACKATLEHMKAEGPQLQERLGARTAALVARINGDLAAKGAGFAAETYSSWFMIDPAKHHRLGGLMFHALRLAGVHVQEGFPCFLTTTHGDAEMDRIADAFSGAVTALQAAEILPGGALSAKPISDAPHRAPLTAAQEEIVLAAQMGPQASCAFNESVRIDLKGELNKQALEDALAQLSQRHDALRARLVKGELALEFGPDVVLTPRWLDISADSDPQAALSRLIQDDARLPFDLVNGPLVRVCVAKVADNAHTVVLTAHHVICDGWSMNTLCSELAALYSARGSGQAAALPASASFARYADQPRAAADLDYWRRLYSTLPERVELPSDRPRAAARGFAGASYTSWLDKPLIDGLRALGARQGATLFASLLASVQTLVARLADATDVVIGAPIAGQTLLEDEPPVGHMVHFLPLRPPLAMNTSFKQHLAGVKQHLFEALDHRGVTYGAITRALGLARDPQRPPLLDVQFNLEKFGAGAKFEGLEVALAPNAKAAVAFDLFFNMIETAEGVRVDVDYDSDLFDAATIARWIENLRTLIAGFVASNGETALSEAPLLGEKETAWLKGRNTPWMPGSIPGSIFAAFAEVAARAPQRVALIQNERRETYASLQQQAGKLAAVLARRGVGAGDRVALVARRGVETIVALIAILQRGAVAAAMDPSHPRARLMAMREDSEAKLTLIGLGVADDVAGPGAVSLDILMQEAEALSPAVPVERTGGDPALVMFTSGSTGRPKGILVPHRGVLRLVFGQDYIRFGADEVFLHMAPLAFDASTLELWGALLHGGAVAIIDAEQASADLIEATIVKAGVTTAWFTAALFHALVDERPQALSPLRQILAGGDVLSPPHVQKAMASAPHARFINGYGPTENTTFTACHVFDAGALEGAAPIGRPLAGTRAFVLDAFGGLAPLGAVGELVVAGEGLALGYLNRPVLTAEKFTACPAAGETLVYRTGDLVRWRKDGALMFLGRRDEQIKINGVRVELGEIEAALAAHPAVGEAAAVVRTDAAGARWIEAFVTGAATPLIEADLQAHVRDRLPSVMVPRRIAVLPFMPRTANGKLDRAALPQTGAALAPVQAVVESMSALEAQIAAIWKEVLGVPTVKRGDAIFSLGADSLQIFRIAARFAQAGLPLEARHMMANPTLADLAAMVDPEGEAGPPTQSAGDAPSGAVSLASFRRGARRKP